MTGHLHALRRRRRLATLAATSVAAANLQAAFASPTEAGNDRTTDHPVRIEEQGASR